MTSPHKEESMKTGAGFTLVEVMIVMVILLILGAMAYPTYAGYITKTRRIEAQVAMIDILQEQERHYSRHHTYVAFSSASEDAAASRFKWWSGSSAAASAYELEARPCADRSLAECVEVRAMPGTDKVDSTFRDPECATLTLSSAGEHASSGTAERCWP
jgi:type IV pilus assembly protein PilE